MYISQNENFRSMEFNRIIKIVAVILVGAFTVISCSTPEDDCVEKTWYQDADGDGFGDPDISLNACIVPNEYVADNTDFDDLNATAYPNAQEICNDQVDNDGNGNIDECIIRQITGNWITNFDEQFVINEASLTDITNNNVFNILVTGEDYLICQNGSDNSFAPDLFSKFVFTNNEANTFNWCQSFFDSPTQMEIEDNPEPSNPNNLTTGCLGFPWGEMERN